MNVVVQEKAIALRPTYTITTPEGELTAVKAWMPIPPKIEITGNGAIVATLKGPLFAFIKPKWNIALADGRSFVFHCEKIIKATYTAVSPTETYTLYTHRSLQFSIFKGEKQVAAFTRNRVSIGSGHTYSITMDSGADVVLLSGIVIAFNTLTADKEKKSIGVEIGHVGPIDREQDTAWQPS
jgi:uncharacterized protein YxjI